MIKKKWKIFFFFLTILFLIHCIIFLKAEPVIPDIEKQNDIPRVIKENIKNNPLFKIFPGILLFILMVSVSSFLKIFEFWNENYKKNKEIENESKTSELNFLKAQLNPHFFFNSLNTIYSLSIVKSEKTSEAILNLSELMRYMLSDKKDNSIERKVRLNDELNYIKNYIELQKFRLTPNNKIDFIIDGNTNNIDIYPLLFISFIENAFKFGVHPVNNSSIKIIFKIQKNVLELLVENEIQFQKNSYDSFGLGNQNSVRRLNLFYPKNVLKIETKENKYIVHLKLNLNEN
jgi:two-component system, LytTR family, sensor kinase